MQSDPLFPYQHAGADFLAARTQAYLADVPGLGKTLQAIRGADRARAMRILVICPASVRTHWTREFLSFQTIERRVQAILDSTNACPSEGVAIVSFDMAIKPEIAQQLNKHAWDLVIFDEAHYLKSHEAKRAQRLIGNDGVIHRCLRHWLLSGTPTPNHAGEVWTTLRVFFPRALAGTSSYEDFLRLYCVVKQTAYGPKVMANKSNIGDLRDAMAPFVLRRTKEEVGLQLPPIGHADIYVDAAPADNTRVLELESGQGGQEMRDWLAWGGADPIHESPSISTLARETGIAKVKPILDIVKNDLASGEDKIVIFAWHREVIGLLSEGLKEFGAVTFTGSTPTEKRQGVVDEFVKNPAQRVFIGQIKAAGTGVDGLQHAAHNVIFAEMSWVPSDNAQAAMRCHRIGQKMPVLIRFAKLAGSLDEAIVTTLRRKTAMVAELFTKE